MTFRAAYRIHRKRGLPKYAARRAAEQTLQRLLENAIYR